MKERPILFSVPMVRAILEGKKTQTRRVIKGFAVDPTHVLPISPGHWICGSLAPSGYGDVFACPYGKPGDRLYVKEGWAVARKWDHLPPSKLPKEEIRRGIMSVHYTADGPKPDWCGRIRSSRFMPRWASRLTLEITEVRVQRLDDLTNEDAVSEGIESWTAGFSDGQWEKVMRDNGTWPAPTHRQAFFALWDSINGKRPGCSWSDNPWVWTLTFKQIKEQTL